MFFKLNKWWVYKIAGGLLTAVLFTVYFRIPVTPTYWSNLAILFGAFISLAVFGHVLNDLSDLQSDRLAGKHNLVERMGRQTALFIILGFASLALSLAFLLEVSGLFHLVVLQIFLNIAYSVRPIRLKERGVLAIVATGFYERTLPYLMIAIVLVGHTEFQLGGFLSTYLLWSFCWEIRNFITGQKADRLLDLQSQQKTVSLVINVKRLNSVQWVLFLLEIALLFLWMIQFENWWLVLLVCIFIGLYFYWREHGTIQVEKLQLFKVVDDAYNLSFPVLFGLLAVFSYSAEIWPIFVILLIAFDNHLRLMCVIIAKNVDWQRWRRWATFPFRTASLIFNWSIYYFRKWVLKWPEERNWGKHYAKHLEEERTKQSVIEND